MLGIIHAMNIWGQTMVQHKKPRNPADFPVLGVLHRGPAHGYDLCRELRERLGEIWTLRSSHVYALLAGLEKDGFVCHERVDQETRPAKKVFSMTDEGRELFLDWVRSPVRNVRDIRLEFLAKLYFAGFDSPRAVTELIADQLSVCRANEKRLRESRRICTGSAERAALDFRLAMVEATVTWLLSLRSPDDSQPQERARRKKARGAVTGEAAPGKGVLPKSGGSPSDVQITGSGAQHTR
jgi:PadR family transcriptional regulator, regulatory protein AphA